MPIEFDNNRVDAGGLDDRRGRGGALAIGGGTGIVGIIAYVIISLLGGDPSQLQLPQGNSPANSTGQAETREEFEKRCNTDGALDQYTDCRLVKTYDIADTVWSDEFNRLGVSYNAPKLAFFESATDTACGQASSQVGPFYCPGDQEIYFDLGFLDQLQQQFGATGEFAQSYILAHEYGHHLQTLLGTERKMRAAAESNPDDANKYSVALELQADCYAGVWAALADKSTENGINLTTGNITEAVKAAQAVGDDRIQEKTQGRVDPESWTHGSAAQRGQWFTTGYQSSDINSCTTFGSLPM